MRQDISNRGYRRGRAVGLTMAVVSVAWLAIAIIAPSLAAAAASAPGHASTSLYRLSLKITSRRFLGDFTENPIAVDRHGNIYVFKATRFTGGSIAVIAPVGPTLGSIQVCFDPFGATAGPCTTVTEHSATAVEREVVFVSGPLTGTHTVDVISQSGSVALDAFAVLG